MHVRIPLCIHADRFISHPEKRFVRDLYLKIIEGALKIISKNICVSLKWFLMGFSKYFDAEDDIKPKIIM